MDGKLDDAQSVGASVHVDEPEIDGQRIKLFQIVNVKSLVEFRQSVQPKWPWKHFNDFIVVQQEQIVEQFIAGRKHGKLLRIIRIEC